MRLLIVDDHRAVADALALALAREHEVAGVLDDHRQVYGWLTQHTVDVVLLDGTLPDCNVFDLIRWITVRFSGTRVLLMTMHPHSSDWRGLRRMGAYGTVSKTLPLDEFSLALVEAVSRKQRAEDGDKALEHPAPTSRQVDLLHAMGRGGDRHQMAAELDLSPARIDDLTCELREKLGDGNWAYLVLRAIEEGWVEPRVPPAAARSSVPPGRAAKPVSPGLSEPA